VAVLDEAVGVVEEHVSGTEPAAARGEAGVGGGAEHGSRGVVEVADLAGAGDDDGRQVPGVGVDQLAGSGIEDGVDRCSQRFGQQAAQRGVGSFHYLGRVRVVDRVGAQHAANLAHD